MKLLTKNGAYMNVYTPDEEKRAKTRGWKLVKAKKAKK